MRWLSFTRSPWRRESEAQNYIPKILLERKAENEGIFCKLLLRGLAIIQLALQPGLSNAQLGPDLLHRQTQYFSGLLSRHAAEEPHLDELRLVRLLSRKCL
jgi:hypothetical protein